MPELHDLSEREREILYLVATGASNKRIAQELYISANTVKVHLRRIFTKIEVKSRTEAAMFAVKAGLIGSFPTRQLEEEPETEEVEEPEILPELIDAGVINRRWLLLGGLAALVVLVVLVGIAWRMGQPDTPASASLAAPTSPPRWQSLATMPTPRRGLAVAAFENQIYAIAGESALGVSGVVERYNPGNDQWQGMASKPLAVTDVSAGVLGGEIYIPDGRLAGGEVTNIVEVYDPRRDVWRQAEPLPQPVSAYALMTFEGKLYLFGGWDGKRYLNETYAYDPDMNEWIARVGMPTARGFAGAAVAGGKIYVIGGYNGTEALHVNEVFFPERDGSSEQPWTIAAAIPESRYGMGVVSVADIIHVFGGEGSPPRAEATWEYFPREDAWEMVASPITQDWSKVGLTLMETRLYILGGERDGIPIGQNLAYQALFTVAIPIIR